MWYADCYFCYALFLFVGKFKGKANEIDLSLDDLVELLHSVDHHKVVNSRDAVISDEQLEALLDRTLTSQEKKNKKKSTKSSSPSAAGDQSLFRVIEERDVKGNITREGDNSAPTTDTWHIVGESDANTTTKGKREDGSANDSDLSNREVEMEADGSNQAMSCTDSRGQKFNDVSGDCGESSVRDCAKLSNFQPNTLPTLYGSERAETIISVPGADAGNKTDEKLPTIIDGNASCNVEPLPNTSELETVDENLVKADVVLCGSTETPVIERDCLNNVSGMATQPDTTYSPESNTTGAFKATGCEGQLETMCNGSAILENTICLIMD